MISDLKYALRSLLKRPAFTAVAVVTLALGIGSATAIFSIVNAVLLRSLPYPNPERLFELRELDERHHGMSVAEPNFNDLAARNRSFDSMARYAAWPQLVAGAREGVRVTLCAVSGDFFPVLDVKPLCGHLFSGPKTEEVAVVSYRFWKGNLGAPVNLEGVTLHFANHSFAVVGVLPPEAEFPQDVGVWYPAEIYPPNESRSAHNWKVIARLKQDVPLEQARAELAAIGQQLKQEHGNEVDVQSFAALPLRERSVQNVRAVLLVVCGAVGFLLVIACSNVANLLLARATARRKEIALRAALGASTARLARQFITESFLLTMIGAVLGILVSLWGVDVIVGLYRGNLPHVGRIGIDVSVLLFSFILALVVALALGLVPVLHASKDQLQSDLQETGRTQSAGATSRRMRNAIIVVQVALTFMLLVGAGLLGRTFQRLLAVNPGFVAQRAIGMTVSMPEPQDLAAKRRLAQFYRDLITRLEKIPGVGNVGATDVLPMSGNGANGRFLIGGADLDSIDAFAKEMTSLLGSDRIGDAQHRIVSGDYFTTMRIPLLRGRLFQDSDGPNNPHVALISESLAHRYFSGTDPIGTQIQFGNMDGDLHVLNIVGIVGDVRDQSLDVDPQPTVYVNYFQRAATLSEFSFVARVNDDSNAAIAEMRRVARAADPEMPVKFQSVTELVSSSLDNRQFSLVMMGVFAGSALILAVVGLYGIVAFITAERTTEVGIRMALGAQRRDVLRLILQQSLVLVLLGIVVGSIAAVGGARLLATFLYGVTAADVPSYAAAVFLLAAAALIASYIPARRAMSVDPAIALRTE
jgi:putative ABC transport system permease protein